VWPYVSADDKAPENISDKFFNDIFASQYDELSNMFLNWEKAPIHVANPETVPPHYSYFQNFAFDYKDHHFICLDFNARDDALTGEGVPPWGDLHDFDGGTWDWFTEHLTNYCEEHPEKYENIILFAHHPFNKGKVSTMGFSSGELQLMYSFLKDYRNEIWGEFAGHTHQNKVSLWRGGIMHVIETDGTLKAPLARIVQVYQDGAIDCSSFLPSGWQQQELQPGDILYDPDSPFNLGPLKIGHVGIYVGNGMVVEAQVGGVKRNSLGTWKYPQRDNVYILRVDCSTEIKEGAVSFAEAQIGKPFDFGWWQKDPNPASFSWYCSELVWAAYYNEGINIEDTPDFWVVAPYEIFADDDTYVEGGHITGGEVKKGMVVRAHSPIDLVVTDPDCLSISKELNEIPGALYMEDDFDGDGSPDDYIIIPEPKTGEYLITVIPEPNASPTDVYTLEVWGTDAAIILAENTPITNIPSEPYVLNPAALDIPPTTLLDVGEPKFVVDDVTCLASAALVTLTAEDNPGGSGVASTAYKISNASFSSGWITYTQSFYLFDLSDGIYSIDYNSTDNAGNVEPTNTTIVILDNAGPSITVLNPPAGWALQDEVTFIASAIDAGSGVFSLNFSIREANGGQGTSVGFDDLPATYNATTGKWSLSFETLLLPDGYYVVLVEASDNLGNIGSTVVPYSIRNWAVVELLPASENNRAGRTMPVKFALRVAAEVDPLQPFVYNEELTIEISATNNPDAILQESTFGDTATDYRISSVHYITNFKTLKKPMQYTVTVYRNTFDIGSFKFKTKK
jgi:hypothetical protein